MGIPPLTGGRLRSPALREGLEVPAVLEVLLTGWATPLAAWWALALMSALVLDLCKLASPIQRGQHCKNSLQSP